MGEPTKFEAHAVLGPRRARRSRLALLLPIVALIAIVWAGATGHRPDADTAVVPDATPIVATSATLETAAVGDQFGGRAPQVPEVALGLPVHGLDTIQPEKLRPDDVVAIRGWYVAMEITDCPPLDAIYKDGALPFLNGLTDQQAYCVRTGILYASEPNVEHARSTLPGPTVIPVKVATGVVMPAQLEVIQPGATEVVVLGQFVESAGCRTKVGCPELVVDHVAWAPGL
jgi:hypothetical protein